MHFAPSNNPNDVEHLVLVYQSDAVIIPLPVTYEDAVQEARNEFRLPELACITLKTRCLPHCEGLEVRINGKAWKTLSHVVPQIDVFCQLRDQDCRRQVDAPLPMAIDEGGPSGSSPRQKNVTSASSGDPVHASAWRRLYVGLPPRRLRQSGGIITQAYRAPRDASQAISLQRAVSMSARVLRQSVSQPMSESGQKSKHQASSAQGEEEEEPDVAMEGPAIEEDELQVTEEEEEAPPPSPKKRSKRPRIDSNTESDGESTCQPSQKFKVDQKGAASSKSSEIGTPKKAPPTAPTKPKVARPERICVDIEVEVWDAQDHMYETHVKPTYVRPSHTVRKVITSSAKSFSVLDGVPVESLKLYLRRHDKDTPCELNQSIADLGIREDDRLVLLEEGPEDDAKAYSD